MGTKVTLGGDRLRSGNKMQVELREWDRSTHDLSYIWRNTMATGTLVPFMSEVGLPGGTYDIDLKLAALTHPTIGPLFGTFDIQLDVFQVPVRLYNSALHNNMLKVGLNMSQVKLPQIRVYAQATTYTPAEIAAIDLDNIQVEPSALLSYFNIRGIGMFSTTNTPLVRSRAFNAVPILGYFDIYKNYYANKQEEIGVIIDGNTVGVEKSITGIAIGGANALPRYPNQSTGIPMTATISCTMSFAGIAPNEATVLIGVSRYDSNEIIEYKASEIWASWTTTGSNRIGTAPALWAQQRRVYYWRYTTEDGQEPKLTTFPLAEIDKMRELILANPPLGNFEIDRANVNIPNVYKIPVSVTGTGFEKSRLKQQGLLVKTYKNDLLNNWLKTEYITGATGVNEISAIDVSSGKLRIESFILAEKVYKMLNDITATGGSYDDWLQASYDQKRIRAAETPMYMGGLMKNIDFQEVVSNASNERQPLGTLAGRGTLGSKHKGGKVVIKPDEHCYMIGIASITPNLDYSQGNKWDMNLKTMDDFHKPPLDRIGFQDLLTEQAAWWDTVVAPTGTLIRTSMGKQPAWINYMTNVNQVRGNFANNEEGFMVLRRLYEPELINGSTTIRLKDATTYIDPSKFNHIFADTRRDAMNFWVQISVDIKARIKMSAKIMPNL